MVDILTVTNVLPTVSATVTKTKIKYKQATRERNDEVVMLHGTVENTANVFFSFVYYFELPINVISVNSVMKTKGMKVTLAVKLRIGLHVPTGVLSEGFWKLCAVDRGPTLHEKTKPYAKTTAFRHETHLPNDIYRFTGRK